MATSDGDVPDEVEVRRMQDEIVAFARGLAPGEVVTNERVFDVGDADVDETARAAIEEARSFHRWAAWPGIG